jgi:flavin reductase (DIM6/NTAB) family NADH-FMN oxidoreductase RutF
MAGSTGCPIIAGARASVECSAWRVYEGGDHSIIVGKVVAAKVLNAKRPLVYYSKKYTTTDAAEYPTHQSRRHRTQAS